MFWKSDYTEKLIEISGKESVLTEKSSLISYENDGLGFHRYTPDCVVIISSSDELHKIINYAKTPDFPYTLRAAGTSLSGGPVAETGGLIIHISRLKNIIEINADDMYCVVEPGVVLQRLNDTLKDQKLFYPPDPSSGFASTLGGNVAENAGGIRCFKYGVTANYVLGVECIMTDGTIRQFGGPAGGRGVSNTLDWRALMPGSEGMIAVFTKIWMRIKPLPEKVWTFLGSYKNLEDATACITDLVQSPAMPVALEFIDNHVVQLVENSKMACGLDKDSWVILTEVDGPEQLVDHAADTIEEIMNRHNPIKVEKTDDETEKLKLWKARKVAGGLMGQISPDLMIQDAVIPRQFLKDILHFLYDEGEKRDIHVLNVFHAGDGNLHPNFLFDRKIEGDLERVKDLGSALMEKVIAYGGTLSGEHGIGNDKRDYIPKIFSVREVSAQSAISEIFNPTHQLNPEKVFPYRSFVGCCAAEKQNT